MGRLCVASQHAQTVRHSVLYDVSVDMTFASGGKLDHKMKLKSQDLNYFPARKQGKDGECEKYKWHKMDGRQPIYRHQHLHSGGSSDGSRWSFITENQRSISGAVYFSLVFTTSDIYIYTYVCMHSAYCKCSYANQRCEWLCARVWRNRSKGAIAISS